MDLILYSPYICNIYYFLACEPAIKNIIENILKNTNILTNTNILDDFKDDFITQMYYDLLIIKPNYIDDNSN